MKVTYNWLRDFVEITIPPQALADKLTMAGLEVGSLEAKGDDWVLEIEITPNRPDCLSVIGIAREIAAITGKALQIPRILQHPTPKAKHLKFSITLEDKKDCPLYTAKIIQDIRVKPSPDWLRQRLELVGCRSVNSVVDITNYILFEYGEPLHAFDLDCLGGPGICVRRGKKEEKIITIDGIERRLGPGILVISDRERPLAIAGIMGGKDTEVTVGTRNVLLEAAIFNPLVIRSGRQSLGMQSESAYRFERGINPAPAQEAAWRAAALMAKISAGQCVLTKSTGGLKARRLKVNLDLGWAGRLLGIDIAPSRARRILTPLGFKAKLKAKNSLSVEVPAHRADVVLAEDLVEEVARISGYENIPLTLPVLTPRITYDALGQLVPGIKNILVGLGLQEIITYSLIDRKLLRAFQAHSESSLVEIRNPLNQEQADLRPTLLPGLLGCVSLNLNRKQDEISLFEVGKVFFRSDDKGLREEWRLALALAGSRPWFLSQGLIRDEVSLLHIKGIIEVILARLGARNYEFRPIGNLPAFGIYLEAQEIGQMRSIPKEALDQVDIKNKRVFVAELSLEKLLPYLRLKKQYAPLPSYPGISRDISIVVAEGIKINDILGAIKERGGPLLKEARVTDYYKGKQIPSGSRGLTISCLYLCDERTLTEAEINPLHSAVTSMLVDKFGVQLR